MPRSQPSLRSQTTLRSHLSQKAQLQKAQSPKNNHIASSSMPPPSSTKSLSASSNQSPNQRSPGATMSPGANSDSVKSAGTTENPNASPSTSTVANSPSNAASITTTAASGTTVATTASSEEATPTIEKKGISEECRNALKLWTYCSHLCKYMYQEGLLDRYEFLLWILELLDRMRVDPDDDGILKLYLPMTLQYLDYFVESERLARRLAFLVCKKLSHMLTTGYETKLERAKRKAAKNKVNIGIGTATNTDATCCNSNIVNRMEKACRIKSETTENIAGTTITTTTTTATSTPTSSTASSNQTVTSNSNTIINAARIAKAGLARNSKQSAQLTVESTLTPPPSVSPAVPTPPSLTALQTTTTTTTTATATTASSQALPPTSIVTSTKHPIETVLGSYLMCPHHHDLILQLSTIIHVITMQCPTALVWCGLGGENRISSTLIGSPLDHLPIPPSMLPMPSRFQGQDNAVRNRLRKAEDIIRKRSKHSELKWCAEKWLHRVNTTNGIVLRTLEILDKHSFDRLDANNNNNLNSLYGKIFVPISVVAKQTVSVIFVYLFV